MSPRLLDKLQYDAFQYFLDLSNPVNGLVPDNTRSGVPASIAAVGFALAAYTVGVERNLLSRAEAISRTLSVLRFLSNSPLGPQPDATGHHGFYYHFLDLGTGRRAWECELSTIDTAFLLAGALAAATYFERDTPDEREVRSLADGLYRSADWEWALNGGETVSHGWRPETGFLIQRWEGYSEALLLYVLGLGSPTHPLPATSYEAWGRAYDWKTVGGEEILHAAPLFIHQLPQVWIDCRGIQDQPMRGRRTDYFENSRRATYAQQRYARANPHGFSGYNERCWGFSACDGPGPMTRIVGGVERRFFPYLARGAPLGPDDGTICLWSAAASLPFAPEIVLPTLHYLQETYPLALGVYGFRCSFNPTFSDPEGSGQPWICDLHYGINQGPLVLMIENYRTGFFWKLMRRCPYIVEGLQRAGFRGGWL